MADLKEYRAKRRLGKTPEPRGRKKFSAKKVFVIQKHDASHLHFDLRLEHGGILKSWAVPKGIPMPGEKHLAMLVEDHPLDYRNFEGVIPPGNYGAGTVMVWDRGTFEPLEDFADSLGKGKITFFVSGQKVKGELALVKFKRGGKREWLLINSKKNPEKVWEETSAKSGKTMEEIALGKKISRPQLKSQMPEFVQPMLAKLEEKSFDDSDWIFEIKLDGYRVIAAKKDHEVSLYSRNQKDYSEIFLPVTKELKKIKGNFVIDGEVVAADRAGKVSFQALQDYMLEKKDTLLYYVFDIIFLGNLEVGQEDLLERKKILQKIIPPKNSIIKFHEFVRGQGQALFEKIKKTEMEGIMAKKIHSPYQTGKRSQDWLKIKSVREQEAVVAGYTKPRGGRERFGALILGIYENGKLKYAGHVGGGFNAKLLETAFKKFQKLKQKKSPFEDVPKTNMPVTWLKPSLVCQVKFSEWTKDGRLRQPIFLGFRDDKDPFTVIREVPAQGNKNDEDNNEEEEIWQINGKKVALTHPQKIFWPQEKYSKKDLALYYRKISPFILPHLKDRPQSLNRFPDGIQGPHFYQKNLEDLPDWAETFTHVSESEKKGVHYLLCQDEAALIYLVNLGCIEINVWNSRWQKPDYPDYMVFDLDPQGVPFEAVVKVALATKKILDRIKIASYCKTSGSRGLHIYVPLGAKYHYDYVREFAKAINILVSGQLPEFTSLERSPEKRKRRVYLDYLQNRRGQTMAAPYSVRPVLGALVSTPLEWKEVNAKLSLQNFTLENTFLRLKKKGDVWKDVLGPGANLDAALLQLEKIAL